MKPLLTLLLLCCFCFSFQEKQEKQKPKIYQVGAAKVTVWENKSKDGSTWKNYKVEKMYKKGEEWKGTNSFNEKELLELKAAIDKAISEEAVKTKE